jgi:hypothetical protein
MRIAPRSLILLLAAGLLVGNVSAQTKKNSRPTDLVKRASAEPTPDPSPIPVKRNGRPSDDAVQKPLVKDDYVPKYFYEFTRPGFLTNHILIEHDASGRGKISFQQHDLADMITDPIQLTVATMTGINDALDRLNFFGSTENYQYMKDLPQMGRKVKFNWTENKDAKFLMDEYRRISVEAVWKFELVISLKNEPLLLPQAMDTLDTYLQMGEITDPPHLVPLLSELSSDERLPLIARNHATRLIKQIEKVKK